MNISLMRRLDFYLGIPICLLLYLYDRIIRPVISILFPFFRRRKEVKEILVMKYFGMGSIILAAPMLRALKDNFPQAEIIFMTFHSNRQIVDMYRIADYIISIRSSNILVFIYDILKTILIIRLKRIDIAIDLEFFAKFSTIMTYISGAPKRVGFYLKKMWRGGLLTHNVYYNPYHHVTEVFSALAHAVGADAKDLSLSRPEISSEADTFLEALLSKEHISPGDRLICVNVNAGDMCIERRWPSGNFAGLVDSLNHLNAGKIIFIGSEEDRYHTNNVVSLLKTKENIINLVGKLDMEQLAALFKRSSLLITCDSGPLHLAVSLDIPTVSFFGPETPALYGPIGDKHAVFYKNLYCSPCLNVYNVKTALYGDKHCFEGDNRCMQAITVEEVLAVIKEEFINTWQG